MDTQLTIIQSKIYEICGQKVMLDFDLAEMYQVETRVLNQSVKGNIQRFPEDFMFQMTSEEWSDMRVSEKGTLLVFFVKVRTFASSDFFICSKMFILEHVNR